MPKISRRTVLRSSAAIAGAWTIGNISACKVAAPDSPVSKKIRPHPLESIERENIKITDVKVTLLSSEIPPKERWFVSSSVCWKRDTVLVEVFTDKGIVGIGGVSMYGGPERLKKYTEEMIKPAILGENPFDVELLTSGRIDRSGEKLGWAGVDNACWDIIGKAKNLPVYKLLAREVEPNTHLRLYASAGCNYAWFKRPENLIDEAVRLKEEGFTAYKFRGGTSWNHDNITMKDYIPLMEKLRDAVGPDFDLMQEANMRWTLEECLKLCPVFEELKFLWFEEPTSSRGDEGIQGHIKIAEALPTVMVACGESRVNRFQFGEWIDRGALDIVQPDCVVCGLTEAWHIAGMAHLKGKLCCVHNWHGGLQTMANASIMASIPNGLIFERHTYYNGLADGVFKEPLVVRNGYMDLPDKPGFGVELIPDIAKKFPYIPGRHVRTNPDL
ncbi:mandelate racemase/muconate lactonizing enzyme family protein [Planctomycetota bacterium]